MPRNINTVHVLVALAIGAFLYHMWMIKTVKKAKG